jgi:CheY-like chemotaxis protein
MAEGRAIYAMAAVERILGESADTVRAWETKYGLPAPDRSPGGQLLYSRDDVERLRWVARELASGREPGEAAVTAPVRLVYTDPLAAGPQILVLLAERDPRAADLQEYFLRTEGYHVEVCASAPEAEAGAAAMQPDVAVVELTLSNHAGLDLCRKLREVSDTAVVAVSSLDSREQALAAGAEAFLLKPLDPLVLVSTIKDLLGASAFLHSRERASDAEG